jgi:hypothetical protein
MGERILDEARALRAAFPDADAMRALPVSALPPKAPDEDEEVTAIRAALGYLRDEMLLVRAGKADSLTVLDDEIAHTESLMLHQ